MAKTIIQKITFRNTTAKILYNLYMNAKKHSMVTGSTAIISGKEGTEYSAYERYITGKNLQLIRDKLIVQTWRADDWDENDMDSTFILHFEQKGNDVILNVVHANLPDKHSRQIDKGWHDHYWDLWKQHLAGKIITS